MRSASDAIGCGCTRVPMDVCPGSSVSTARVQASSDPVITTDSHGEAKVLGGFSATSDESIQVARSTSDGKLGDGGRTLACDLILMAVGYSPAAHLLHHAGTKFAYDTSSHMYRPDSAPAHVFAAGSVNAAYALESVLADGRRAGWKDPARRSSRCPAPRV